MPHENVILCDTKGVIYNGRTEGMNQWKSAHAVETKARTLADALDGADVFLGLSVKGAMTQDMVKRDGDEADHLRLANPDPEITPEDVRAVRPDAIVATGRSDYPNQVNNVLGFPYIFRGALDVRARTINEEMKIAAAQALAELAREDVPDEVAAAYRGARPNFGPDYIIPVPFDPRLISRVPSPSPRPRWRAASRASRSPISTATRTSWPRASIPSPRSFQRVVAARARAAEARRLRRRRGRAGHPRRARLSEHRARPSDPGRRSGAHSRRTALGARHRCRRDELTIHVRARERARRICRGALQALAAPRRAVSRLRAPGDLRPQHLRRLHRRRRPRRRAWSPA